MNSKKAQKDRKEKGETKEKNEKEGKIIGDREKGRKERKKTN